MESNARDFPQAARAALGDSDLRFALDHLVQLAIPARKDAVDRRRDFEELRTRAAEIRDRGIARLDKHLELFEENATGHGATVHWCETADDARETIASICRQRDARRCVKGKSMLSEEIGLAEHLEEIGVSVTESDVGEYILQLGKERPSHIVGPALHKSIDEVRALFAEHHASPPRRAASAEELVVEAREVLRPRYFEADIGITGANFLIADTGSVVLVTNEGNGDLAHLLPRTVVVVVGIDKIIATLDELPTLLRVLARSATGQELTVYTTLITGPKRAQEQEGPEQVHIVLVDNGRSDLLGGPAWQALRCIRCGACLDHCPIYHSAGGHAYGWVYPGPIGAVINPALLGLEEAVHLPQATTACGRCEEVCPVKIPLPEIMHQWRARAFDEGLGPSLRWSTGLWAWLAVRPRLYRVSVAAFGLSLRALRRMPWLSRVLPGVRAWTAERELPPSSGPPFSRWDE